MLENSNYCPLSLAASYGSLEIVQALVSTNADIDGTNCHVRELKPLVASAEQGHVEIVRFLLNSNARIQNNRVEKYAVCKYIIYFHLD